MDELGNTSLDGVILFIRRNFWKAMWFGLGLFVAATFYDWTRYDYKALGSHTWVKHDSRTGITFICFVPDAQTSHAYPDDLLGCDARYFIGPFEALKMRSEMRNNK